MRPLVTVGRCSPVEGAANQVFDGSKYRNIVLGIFRTGYVNLLARCVCMYSCRLYENILF